MNKFYPVAKYPDAKLPSRSTSGSAGYDLYVAENIVISPYFDSFNALEQFVDSPIYGYTLEQMSEITKKQEGRPTLISTGVKCQMDSDLFLSIQVRSSTPLKYLLVIPNAPAIIDSDYYNNPSNEGEIFLQVINLSPFSIALNKGDCIAQGIFQKYYLTDDDKNVKARRGGFGSTGA